MHYRIDWDALNRLSPDQRMAALAAVNTSIRTVTGAERARMVHRAVAEHGTQKNAAAALGISPGRVNQIIKENSMSQVTVTISRLSPAELHRQYSGQEAQPCYVEVDLKNQYLSATYNAEVGNAVPSEVLHGFERRYAIPALTSTAANTLLEKIRPLAERMVSDWEEIWDGNNMTAVLGDDARAAAEKIQALCGDPSDWDFHWDSSQCITVWDVDGATNGDEAEEFGITGATTDERLAEIEEEIRDNLKGISDSDEVVLEGVTEYLENLRDDLAQDQPLGWSVVRGESPGARAVEPGAHGIAVPDEILAWAQEHGLDGEDPDVYLLVTTEDEAGEVVGEIDYTTLEAPFSEAAKVRAALAEEEQDGEALEAARGEETVPFRAEDYT